MSSCIASQKNTLTPRAKFYLALGVMWLFLTFWFYLAIPKTAGFPSLLRYLEPWLATFPLAWFGSKWFVRHWDRIIPVMAVMGYISMFVNTGINFWKISFADGEHSNPYMKTAACFYFMFLAAGIVTFALKHIKIWRQKRSEGVQAPSVA